jgi:glutathione S-transferase
MVLTLYGVPVSTCTQRVTTVLLEKKVAFKFVEIDFPKGEHKSAEYLKKQPFGQIPVLDVRRIPFDKCLALMFYI